MLLKALQFAFLSVPMALGQCLHTTVLKFTWEPALTLLIPSRRHEIVLVHLPKTSDRETYTQYTQGYRTHTQHQHVLLYYYVTILLCYHVTISARKQHGLASAGVPLKLL